MASLHKDNKSPFWYLKYKSSDGKWRSKSTGFRHGIGTKTRKAQMLRAKHDMEETAAAPRREARESWVPGWIKLHYANSQLSAKRVEAAWRHLASYFEDQRITSAQGLTYQACVDYLGWRIKQNARHNTALLALKFLGTICKEAIRRGIITVNPAIGLGIRRKPVKEKPELTDAQIIQIRAGLKTRPEWMAHAFEIAIHTGCRISETALFSSDIDLERDVMHFRKTKTDKPFTTPINPALRPLLERLVARGTTRILELPPSAPRHFHRFFKQTKLSALGITFHCTRVTVITRFARSGDVNSDKAMRAVNHSSELVHRSYQRLQPQDVAEVYAALKIPVDFDNTESTQNPD